MIQPDSQPKIYDTTNDVKSALDSGQIDALVTDVVTTVYLRDFEIKGSQVIGQYPTDEHFGMLFEKSKPLVKCVNEVLTAWLTATTASIPGDNPITGCTGWRSRRADQVAVYPRGFSGGE